MPTPQEWFQQLPPITRGWFVIAVGTTVLFMLGYVNPMELAWIPEAVIQKFQLWRLLTSFFFFGKFSIGFVFQLYLLQSYSKQLELEPFACRPRGDNRPGTVADYVWMLIVCAALLCVGSWAAGQTPAFLGFSLSFTLIYVWARKHADAIVTIYSFDIQAIYLPWVMMMIGMMLGNNPMTDLMGIAAGHFFYFFAAVMPLNEAYGINLLAMPSFLRSALEVPALLRDGGHNVRGFVANAGGAAPARDAAPRGGGWGALGRGHRLND